MRAFAPRRGEATLARLELVRGRGVTLHAAQNGGELCRAVLPGRAPKATNDNGCVRIEYPRLTRPRLARRPDHRSEIELNALLPWTLHFLRGLGDSAVDLRALELVGLRVTGGASNVRLLLPQPRGDVRVRIENGASNVALVRPAHVPASLGITGGATRLTFDGERYGAVGGATRLVSSATPTGTGYEIEVVGGASDLTITEVDTTSDSGQRNA